MKVELKYAGSSAIISGLGSSRVALATNVLREPAFLEAELGRPLLARDGLATLHGVVTSDLKYRPKDRLAFRLWLEDQDRAFLQSLELRSAEVRAQLEAKEARLAELRSARMARRAPFLEARKRYLDYALDDAFETSFLLDPIVTVHPDELSFEAFSRDESSYARFAMRHDLFSRIDAFELGTTNVDFSSGLARQVGRMRTYRATRFDVSPRGFGVGVGDSVHHEKVIDLPETWVKGLLEVQSVMTLGLTRLRLLPIDLFNLLRHLRRFKARRSPRALRWELRPGERAKVVFEPWEDEAGHTLQVAAVYQGAKPVTLRTWGRRRLLLLERLLPVARSVDVYLAGHGQPTVWVIDLGDATFTLALSGWIEEDWTGDSRFALLSRKLDVDADQLATTYHALRGPRHARADALATATGLSLDVTKSALSFLCQAGRAMVDLATGEYRHRDLFHTPFDATKEAARLRRAAEESDPMAKLARQIVDADGARLIAQRPVKTGYKLSGSVASGPSGGSRLRPLLHVDGAGDILEATCTCGHFKQHKLTKGPCEHVLALRLVHMRRLEAAGGSA